MASTKTASWPMTMGEKEFPDGPRCRIHRLFIACRKPAQLAVYDSTNGKLLSQTECVGDADDLFYDEKSRRAYVVGGEGFRGLFPSARRRASATANRPSSHCAARADWTAYPRIADVGRRRAEYGPWRCGGAALPSEALRRKTARISYVRPDGWTRHLERSYARLH